MKDGIILLDTVEGKELGFTSDKFTDHSFLWKKDDYIYISVVESREKGKGHLSKLFDTILKDYGIKVPTPFPLMEAILIRKGFTKTEGYDEKYDENVEVWIKEKNK